MWKIRMLIMPLILISTCCSSPHISSPQYEVEGIVDVYIYDQNSAAGVNPSRNSGNNIHSPIRNGKWVSTPGHGQVYYPQPTYPNGKRPNDMILVLVPDDHQPSTFLPSPHPPYPGPPPFDNHFHSPPPNPGFHPFPAPSVNPHHPWQHPPPTFNPYPNVPFDHFPFVPGVGEDLNPRPRPSPKPKQPIYPTPTKPNNFNPNNQEQNSTPSPVSPCDSGAILCSDIIPSTPKTVTNPNIPLVETTTTTQSLIDSVFNNENNNNPVYDIDIRMEE